MLIHADGQSLFGNSAKVAGQLCPKAAQYVEQRPAFTTPPQMPPPVGLAAMQRVPPNVWPTLHPIVSGNDDADGSLTPGVQLNPAHESRQSCFVGDGPGRK